MVAIDFKNVESHQAVFVGDLLSFYTRVMAVDRTSITVHVTVETDREGKVEQIADAEVTYETLKLEEQGRQPVPIRGEC